MCCHFNLLSDQSTEFYQVESELASEFTIHVTNVLEIVQFLSKSPPRILAGLLCCKRKNKTEKKNLQHAADRR
jgi:hypothetical protein